MAITISDSDLANACRIDPDNTDELAQITRLKQYATEAILTIAPDAPDVIHNEAAIRICGYLYDQPFSTPSVSYANALRNSGAAAILQTYRAIGVGLATETGALVAGGTGGTGTGLPPIPVAGEFVLETREGRLIWTEYIRLLQHEIFGALTGGDIPQIGDFIQVASVDAQNGEVEIAVNDDVITTPKLTNILTDYPTLTALATTLSDYITSTGLATELMNYVLTTTLTDELDNYTTQAEVEEILSALQATADPIQQSPADTRVTANTKLDLNLSLDEGVYLVIYTLQVSTRNVVRPELINSGEVTLIDFGLIRNTSNNTLTRILKLDATTDIELFYTYSASRGSANITNQNIQFVQLQSTVVIDTTARAEAEQALEASNNNRIIANQISDQTMRLHAIHGTPTQVTNLTHASMFIHSDPPPTNMNGVAIMDKPNPTWKDTDRVFVRLRDGEARTDYRVVFKGSDQDDYVISGGSWRVRSDLVASGYTFYSAWRNNISQAVDSITLETSLGDTLYDGQVDNNIKSLFANPVPNVSRVGLVIFDRNFQVNAANVGKTQETDFGITHLSSGRVFIRIHDNNIDYVGYTTRGDLLDLATAATGTTAADQAHIAIANGYLVGRLADGNLWFSVPSTRAATTVSITILSETNWIRYYTDPMIPRLLPNGATKDQIAVFDGSNWQPSDQQSGGGGVTPTQLGDTLNFPRNTADGTFVRFSDDTRAALKAYGELTTTRMLQIQISMARNDGLNDVIGSHSMIHTGAIFGGTSVGFITSKGWQNSFDDVENVVGWAFDGLFTTSGQVRKYGTLAQTTANSNNWTIRIFQYLYG